MRSGPRLRSLLALSLLTIAPVSNRLNCQAPEAAPGLRIPNGNRPYALDVFDGAKELIPLHSSAVQPNNHKGANLTGGLLAGPFYKAKFTTELAGATARSIVHSATPSFYVRMQQPEEGDSMIAGWAIVHAAVNKDHRLLSTVKFTQFSGTAKRNDSQVDVNVTNLSDGWIMITPKAPLANGEYALLPVTKQENTFSTSVFDFRIDPAAPNAADAITAEQ